MSTLGIHFPCLQPSPYAAMLVDRSTNMSNTTDSASNSSMSPPQLSPDLTQDTNSSYIVSGTPKASTNSKMSKCNFCLRRVNDAVSAFLENEGCTIEVKACATCINSACSSELQEEFVSEKKDEKELILPLPLSSVKELDGDNIPETLEQHDGEYSQDKNSVATIEMMPLMDSNDEILQYLDNNDDIFPHNQFCDCWQCKIAADMIEHPNFNRFSSYYSPLDVGMLDSNRVSSPMENPNPFPGDQDLMEALNELTSGPNSKSNHMDLLDDDDDVQTDSMLQEPCLSTASTSVAQPQGTAPRVSFLPAKQGMADRKSSSARTRGNVRRKAQSKSLLETHLTAQLPTPLHLQLGLGEVPAPETEFTSASRSNSSRGRRSQRGGRGRLGGRGVRGGGVTKVARKGKNGRGGRRGQASQGRAKQLAKKAGDHRTVMGTTQRGATGGRASGNSRGGASKRGGAAGAAQPAEDHQRAKKFVRCKTCKRAFNNWIEVHLHQQSNECDDGVLICKGCGERFAAADVMYRHFISARPDHFKNA